MKIETFVFFESVNQNLSFHVHNVKLLSLEPLNKLSGTLSKIIILCYLILNRPSPGFALQVWA